jgi:hypothetical protein
MNKELVIMYVCDSVEIFASMIHDSVIEALVIPKLIGLESPIICNTGSKYRMPILNRPPNTAPSRILPGRIKAS